jgi:alpha-tubulin suppressor-like RCC1 family protein
MLALMVFGASPVLAGKPFSWGYSSNGELGNGTTDPRDTPVRVDLKGIVAMDAGCYHVLAVKKDGSVRAWGSNGSGELGDNTTDQRESPVRVHGLDNVKAVAAGCAHSLALMKNGTVRAWGDNSYGELGDGTDEPRYEPVKVKGVDNIKAIAAGYYYSALLKKNGRVLTWGYGLEGALGHGDTDNEPNPKLIQGLDNVKSISASEDANHMLALKENGTVRGWGLNTFGQVGNNFAETTVYSPVVVKDLDNVRKISAGYTHSLALLENGTIRGWGYNGSGELGDGTYEEERHRPVRMRYISNATGISAAEHHSLVLLATGRAKATGYNAYGQLGDNTNVDKPVAVPVMGLSNLRSVTASYDHSHALKR